MGGVLLEVFSKGMEYYTFAIVCSYLAQAFACDVTSNCFLQLETSYPY